METKYKREKAMQGCKTYIREQTVRMQHLQNAIAVCPGWHSYALGETVQAGVRLAFEGHDAVTLWPCLWYEPHDLGTYGVWQQSFVGIRIDNLQSIAGCPDVSLTWNGVENYLFDIMPRLQERARSQQRQGGQ